MTDLAASPIAVTRVQDSRPFLDRVVMVGLRSVTWPRQVAIALAAELTPHSWHEIGRRFGRDHTTVLHAVRKISQHRAKDSELNHALHVLEQTLKG